MMPREKELTGMSWLLLEWYISCGVDVKREGDEVDLEVQVWELQSVFVVWQNKKVQADVR